MLWKIPFILASALLDRIILTPPNPPPEQEEWEKYGKHLEAAAEKGILPLAKAMPLWMYFTYIMSMFEIFVIVCTALDHRELTTFIIHPAAVHKIGLTTTYLAGFLIKLVGTWLRFDAYRQLGPTYTFQLSIRKDHKLVTTGVYAIVRHPGYSGAVWFFLGTVLCQMGRGSYWAAAGMWGEYGYGGVVFGTVYLVLPVYMVAGGFPRIWKEDEMLRALFREEWEVWARRTPYRLIPLIY